MTAALKSSPSVPRPRKKGQRQPVKAPSFVQRRRLSDSRAVSSDLRRRLRWAIDNELSRRGLTVTDLGRMTGRDRATVSHALRSARVASLDVLLLYAVALGLEVQLAIHPTELEGDQ